MESGTRLIKVSIPHTKSFKIIHLTDFRKYGGNPLPGVEGLLNGIENKLKLEKDSKKKPTLKPC